MSNRFQTGRTVGGDADARSEPGGTDPQGRRKTVMQFLFPSAEVAIRTGSPRQDTQILRILHPQQPPAASPTMDGQRSGGRFASQNSGSPASDRR